ncbi:MAG: hypothetical protein WBD22_09580 [Pyrinomonadaceae bacterium]
MYRRPKFLGILLDIRREMAHEADYDVDLFAEMVRSGSRPEGNGGHKLLDEIDDDRSGTRPSKTTHSGKRRVAVREKQRPPGSDR